MPESEGVLGPLSGEHSALVERYPLPEGVPDAVVNKADLGLALRVSQTTLSHWIAAGLPREIDGSNGRSYGFRLSVAYAWRCEREEREATARALDREAAQQLSLALLGGESADERTAGLTTRQEREQLELEHARAVAARDRGELIRAREVVEGFEAVFAAIRDAMDALPDRLGRELALDGEGIVAAERACDDALAACRTEVMRVIGDEGAAA